MPEKSDSMKLIVNVRSLKDPLTGVGRYVLNLLREVNKRPEVEDLVGVTLTGFLSRDQLQRLMHELDHVSGPKKGVLRRLLGWVAQKKIARDMQFRWISLVVLLNRRAYASYIYWETNGDLLPFRCPKISTVYDLSFLVCPEFHLPTKVKELTERIPDYLYRSDRVIAISKYTRSEIEKHYHPESPIDIVKPGIENSYFTITENYKLKVKAKLILPDHYVLSVSTIEPRKNINRLLVAYNALPSHIQKRFPLLLAGAKGWMSNDLEVIIENLQKKNVVRYLGYVDQKDLPAVVSLASLNVYVSLYEGFGMPIAESMAAGTPVLCSNVTSMPEVAAGCCFMVDPFDVDSISSKMQMLLTSESLRTSKVELARQQALEYTWERSASSFFDSIKAVQS